ncbi:unnamed protein product [Prorocentrum cordatum]|uniref:Uncharacterized protein n=1 Tax=Prorocentrum cordatum TaxID=2364126 RepID=A0ABN9Q975_9DINO|nr:unnamed protein product [Polarella glacialis]
MLLDHKVQGENHNIETTRPPIVQLLDISSSMIVACVEDANSTGSTDQSTKLSFERQTCDHRILPQRAVWNIYGCSRADGRRGVRRTTAGQAPGAPSESRSEARRRAWQARARRPRGTGGGGKGRGAPWAVQGKPRAHQARRLGPPGLWKLGGGGGGGRGGGGRREEEEEPVLGLKTYQFWP